MPAANDGCLSFFLTDFGSRPSRPAGRTRPHAEHRLNQLFRVSLFTEDRRAVLRMLVERGVDLVVEVVEERDRAPELLVLAVEPRIRAHRRLDCERVSQER